MFLFCYISFLYICILLSMLHSCFHFANKKGCFANILLSWFNNQTFFQSDADVLIICALESIYAALAIMTHQDIPKQLYKEEVR